MTENFMPECRVLYAILIDGKLHTAGFDSSADAMKWAQENLSLRFPPNVVLYVEPTCVTIKRELKMAQDFSGIPKMPAPRILFTPDFQSGVAIGVKMSDIEVLRFYNGIIAAMYECRVSPTRNSADARAGLLGLMEMLKAEENCLAFIGHNGTPIIKPVDDNV